jgi:hypothetical protein
VKGQIVLFCLLLGATKPLTPLFAQGDQKYTSPRIFALQKSLKPGMVQRWKNSGMRSLNKVRRSSNPI